MRHIFIALTIFALTAPILGDEAMKKPAGTVTAELNGLQITLDSRSGSILQLSYPGPGTILRSSPDRAGILDLAYPVKDFEPLRLASRFSDGARIETSPGLVTIHWDRLGASRGFVQVEGSVSAVVRLRAAPDGRSIIMTCEIENNSKNDVRQVIFPDFAGLLPFCGKDRTAFRTGGFASLPFLELAPNEGTASTQYMVDYAAYQVEYKAGGIFNPMFVRWMDLGGLTGGLSLFPKRWGWDPQITVRLHLSETDDSLRLLCLHDAIIKPGGKWESGEFVLTPHDHGWAKGIEPYREFVKSKLSREWPVPKRVREGIGYRTVWMCQNQPSDPRDAIFTFKDLPKLAKGCKEYGIDEMVVWAWNKAFVLPLPPPSPHLGTEQEMADAVKECQRLGVNVAPFISVLQANAENAPRYGLRVTDNNGWTYHTELIPRWNPPYATSFACVPIPITNPIWQDDVLSSCTRLVDMGIYSLSWDQFWAANETPNIHTLTSKIRAYSKARDQESTFSGEELWNLELDSGYLDYTWDWGGYRDCRAFTSVFPAPRINSCISYSPLAVKKAFADSLYMNLMPRKKDSVNASDYISSYPDLGKALKQCARLRQRFLRYFTEGTLIGDCILAEPCPGMHVTAYVLPDRALMVLINEGAPRQIPINCDLGAWVRSTSGKYEARCFDEEGAPHAKAEVPTAVWRSNTPKLPSGGMVLYEFTAR